jgi:hypothetical protein
MPQSENRSNVYMCSIKDYRFPAKSAFTFRDRDGSAVVAVNAAVINVYVAHGS